MLDAAPVVERLRREIPAELGPLRDLDFPTRLSDTLTLSTFHGCPPDEIERIVEYLLREHGLALRRQAEPDAARRDARCAACCTTCWATRSCACPTPRSSATRPGTQAAEFVRPARRPGARARARLRREVHQHADRREPPRASSRPSEREMYLSGPPLHVLAMHLVRRFRARVRRPLADVVLGRHRPRTTSPTPWRSAWCRSPSAPTCCRPGGYARGSRLLRGARAAHGRGRRGDSRRVHRARATVTAARQTWRCEAAQHRALRRAPRRRPALPGADATASRRARSAAS